MNHLLKPFITRPVLTSALSLFILLLGIFAICAMPIRYLPQINQEMINIHIAYPGADNAAMKSFVTTKIQNALVGIEGIDYITSSSAMGYADIKLYLTTEAKADILLSIVRGKISSIESELPDTIKPPVVSENNIDQRPMLILSFTSHIIDRVAVADYLRRVIVPQIESISGIAQAEVWGDQYAMQIYLDPTLLMAYHLVPQDVFNALKAQNMLTASGASDGKWFDYQLTVNSDLHTEEEFNQMVIQSKNKVPIYLHDVGYAKKAAADDQFMVYYNNQPATFIGVQILPRANPLSVVKKVLTILPQLTKNMPADLMAHVVLNRTVYIQQALYEVSKALLESILIVFFVVAFFLGHIKAALIPLVTIPISLLGVCFFMQSMHYSINTITLLAMVLAVSLVVDDAIVLVEQCMRHMPVDHSIVNTVWIATQELAMPIIAMTLTLTAVYLPIGFTGGLIGQLFAEFALTLAGSVVISGILALTLSPMMVAHCLNSHRAEKNALHEWSEACMTYLSRCYRYYLLWAVKNKKCLLCFWFALLCLVGLLYYIVPKELVPQESMNFLLVSGEAPTHANRSYLMYYATQAQKIYTQVQGMAAAVILAPDERYVAYLILSDYSGNAMQLMHWLQKKLSDVTGLTLHVIAPPAFINAGPAVQFVLQGNEDYQTLYHYAKQIESAARSTGLFSYLADDLQYTEPQAVINVDRLALAALNIPMASVANAISVSMSQHAVQSFSHADQSDDVLIKMLMPHPENLLDLPIQVTDQIKIPLSSVAKINYRVVPKILNQFQKINSVTINGEMQHGVMLSQGLSALQHIAALTLPKTLSVDYAGATRQFYQEAHRMLWIFLLAGLIIFLILSMQFDSYRDAWIILLGSVPMALFSALLPLWFGVTSLNIYTEIGLLTLIGLISKHGILIVRFANEIKVKQQIDAQSAVMAGALLRLRPILMTSAAVLLAALPLIFSSIASLHAIGWVLFFGMGFGTCLTLFLLPVVYIFFNVRCHNQVATIG